MESLTRIELHITGNRDSPLAYDLRDFLYRSGVSFDWQESPALPVCIFPDGSVLHSPSIHDIAEKLGFIHKPKYQIYDVVIFGAGPAGLSTAVYTASEGLKTVVVEKGAVGGQASTSSSIENYLGFPEGISGAALADLARRQAIRMGAEILLISEGTGAYIQKGLIHCRLRDGNELIAKAGVCATGVTYRKLDLADEDRFYGSGVFYGAGAGEARFSATLSAYLIDKIKQTARICVRLNCSVVDLSGEKHLENITVTEGRSGPRENLSCRHLFVCVGGTPNNAWSRQTRLVRDEAGYFVTGSDLYRYQNPVSTWAANREPFYLETNIPGVFAVGDVRNNSIKRIASAVGEGAVVTHFLWKYLLEAEHKLYRRSDTPVAVYRGG